MIQWCISSKYVGIKIQHFDAMGHLKGVRMMVTNLDYIKAVRQEVKYPLHWPWPDSTFEI